MKIKDHRASSIIKAGLKMILYWLLSLFSLILNQCSRPLQKTLEDNNWICHMENLCGTVNIDYYGGIKDGFELTGSFGFYNEDNGYGEEWCQSVGGIWDCKWNQNRTNSLVLSLI